jgi:hypothetical protein
MTQVKRNSEDKANVKIRRRPNRRGRPLQIYMAEEFLAAIDDWRDRQIDRPNRSEAFRRLVAAGLKRLS